MQTTLEALQPQLVEAAAKVQETLKKVEIEQAEAAEVERNVAADEEVANEQVREVFVKMHHSLLQSVNLGNCSASY